MPKKSLHFLPNFVTVIGLIFSIYLILYISTYNGNEIFIQSLCIIFISGFFDISDGKIARLTNTQSRLGIQLDSLADIINFGIAPAIVIYKWALWTMGLFGIFFDMYICNLWNNKISFI